MHTESCTILKCKYNNPFENFEKYANIHVNTFRYKNHAVYRWRLTLRPMVKQYLKFRTPPTLIPNVKTSY